MGVRIVWLDVATSLPTVDVIVVVLSKIGHGGGLVIVEWNDVVPIHACT